VDAQDAEGPGARAGHVQQGRQRLLEQPGGDVLQGGGVGAPQHRAQRPQRPAVAVLGADLFQPGAAVVHEVAEAAGHGVEGVSDERQIARGEFKRLRVSQFLQIDADDERAGVIVDAVPLAVVGYGEEGVLQQAGVVGHAPQVVEAQGGQLDRPPVERLDRKGRGGVAAFGAGAAESFQIALRDLGPDHVASKQIGPLAHGVALGFVVQQVDHLFGQRRRVAERNQHAALVGQHLFGVPVGGGDDRFARADGVGQRAGGDLAGVQVGCDVDVGRADELSQFLDANEAVVEDDLALDALLLGQPLQRQAVALAVVAQHVGVGRAEDDVDDVGVLFQDGRQGLDDRLDALVGRQQAEGQEHSLALHAKVVLVEARVNEGHVGDAVGNLVRRDAIDALQKARAALAHDDNPLR